MSNNTRGIVDVVTKEKTYQFQLDYNALCDVESNLGVTLMDLLGGKVQFGLKELRVIFWAGLKEFAPDLTLKDAGKIIGEIGFEKATDIFNKSRDLALKYDQESNGAATGKGKPKKARGLQETSQSSSE